MLVFYHPPSFRQLHGNSRTRMQEIKRIDWVGILLLVAGLVLFLLGVSWGKTRRSTSKCTIVNIPQAANLFHGLHLVSSASSFPAPSSSSSSAFGKSTLRRPIPSCRCTSSGMFAGLPCFSSSVRSVGRFTWRPPSFGRLRSRKSFVFEAGNTAMF